MPLLRVPFRNTGLATRIVKDYSFKTDLAISAKILRQTKEGAMTMTAYFMYDFRSICLKKSKNIKWDERFLFPLDQALNYAFCAYVFSLVRGVRYESVSGKRD